MKKSIQLMFHLLFWIFTSLFIILGFQLLSLPAMVLGTGGPDIQEQFYVLLIALPIGGCIFYTSYFSLNFFVKRPIRFIWVSIFYAILISVLILVEVLDDGDIDFLDILILLLPILYFNIFGFLFKTFIEWINDRKIKAELEKEKWTTSENANRIIPIIAVILTLTCISCSENPLGTPFKEEVSYLDRNIITEYFKASPSGSTIHAFGGDVILDFPPGTVPTTTRYEIVAFPLDHLDLKGKNVMMRAFSLKNVTNKNEFENPVTLIIRYDLCGYNKCQPGEESDLAIFNFIGDRNAVHKIEALGECCMNYSCKTVQTCIDECGTYILVEM